MSVNIENSIGRVAKKAKISRAAAKCALTEMCHIMIARQRQFLKEVLPKEKSDAALEIIRIAKNSLADLKAEES